MYARGSFSFPVMPVYADAIRKVIYFDPEILSSIFVPCSLSVTVFVLEKAKIKE